jgi:hypothetical protein
LFDFFWVGFWGVFFGGWSSSSQDLEGFFFFLSLYFWDFGWRHGGFGGNELAVPDLYSFGDGVVRGTMDDLPYHHGFDTTK